MPNEFNDLDDLLPGGGEGLTLSVPQAGGGALGAALSPCDQGEEIDVAFIQVQQGQNVNLRVVLCNSPFRVRVFRDQTVIFDEENLVDEVNVPVAGLTPGFHSLIWGFLASSSPWKARSEVSVNGVVEFCLKKGNDSSMPSNQLSVFLQVT